MLYFIVFFSWFVLLPFELICLTILSVPPQISPFDFGEDAINEGDSALLQCFVHKGDIPINITWFHNNQALKFENGIQISKMGNKVSSLSIESVQGDHAGTYTCVAQNRAGSTEHETVLHINGTF